MFNFVKRAIQDRQPRQAKEASSPCSSNMTRLEKVRALRALAERVKQQRLADAHEAAASGEGPQPWDREWFEYESCIENDISEIAYTIGWHRTQDFLEVLDWALASPQGQRALAQAGDDASPWQGALEMIKELQRPLIEASHLMLRSHAEGLDYAIEGQPDIWEAFNNFPGPLHNITRKEG
jgi:hypothetical protein